MSKSSKSYANFSGTQELSKSSANLSGIYELISTAWVRLLLFHHFTMYPIIYPITYLDSCTTNLLQQICSCCSPVQVCEHLQRVAKPLGVWVAPIVGGISPAKQTRLLGRQPQASL